MRLSFVSVSFPVVGCHQTHPASYKKLSRKSKVRDGGVGTTVALNRLLFHQQEIEAGDENETSTVHLSRKDYRACHIRDVLRLPREGSTVRAAVLGGLLYDDAAVDVQQDESVVVSLSSAVQVREPPLPPPVTLILAVPRPKVLARLLPQIAAMGVSNIVLCNAYKVERCYFDSFLLRDEAELEQHLIEGISQCGVDSRLPVVSVEKRLKVFLEDRLHEVSPPHSHRVIAHPDLCDESSFLPDMFPHKADSTGVHYTLAIGPEGGWMPREVSMLQENFGFNTLSLGNRILRSDAACLVLLGLIHSFIRRASKTASILKDD